MPVMDHIAILLPKVLRKRGLKDEADAAYVVHTANQWIRENMGELAQDIRATKFVSPVLVLGTSSSVAAQECTGRNEELLSHLRERLPGLPIERVRFLREAKS